MDTETIAQALLLGVVEGLTEFIPVSSTAHLLLLGELIGFQSTGKTFEVLIQLGAICAILSVYSVRLTKIAVRIPTDPGARRFVFGVLLAFLPAAIIGVMLHGFIKTVLFETPSLVCSTLIIGGVALLLIDRRAPTPRYHDATQYPLWLALSIGFCQVLAMVPGVSRSGATIGGALLLKADKRSAAEFSFFLAIPTMSGAFAYDLYANRNVLSVDDVVLIAVGFVAAFISAVFVVRALLDFVSRHGFAPFAWWRIGVGVIGLALIHYSS
ncbi:MAG: undecaprenyl-diphosphate phosphatase [Pseudomonadota bacterium]